MFETKKFIVTEDRMIYEKITGRFLNSVPSEEWNDFVVDVERGLKYDFPDLAISKYAFPVSS